MSVDSAIQRGLHVMAKPIGPICNLDCHYCYYLHKEELYPGGERWRMPDETLAAYIRQFIDAQPPTAEEITFAWQGGEPTLLGLEFFRHVVKIQQEFRPAGTRIVNTLQTNGILLDDAWCEFFAAEKFLVGLSIDGPAELHNEFRVDRKRQGPFSAVMSALKKLKQHRVEFNILTVVHRGNGDHGERVYTYLRDNGVEFLQFIPLVEKRGVGRHGEPRGVSRGDGDRQWDDRVSSRSVRPAQFGRFLTSVFDEWIKRDVGRVFVQIFDEALAAWSGLEPSLCVFRKRCGRALAMEHNGDLYSCDHFVEPAYRLGNIHELPIVQLANLPQQQDFGNAKETTLPQYCRACSVRFACNGECPKNRFIETPDGESGLNYLCAGYKLFFQHIDPVMKQMAEEVRRGRPAANVMQQLRQARRTNQPAGNVASSLPSAAASSPGQRTPSRQSPGRNDPCPCGSGRKAKKCCYAR